MNAGACRAARSDRRLSGRTGKVPREMKRAWAEMSQKERARLRRKWRGAQHNLGILGEMKQSLRREAEEKAKTDASDSK